MTKNRLALIATLAFFLGCASAPLIETLFVPPLSAQQVAAGVQRWETLMWQYQQALPGASPGEKWRLMSKIFEL